MWPTAPRSRCWSQPSNIRRARVWNDVNWALILPGQKWKAGEVTSPLELELLDEKKYFKELGKVGFGAALGS